MTILDGKKLSEKIKNEVNQWKLKQIENGELKMENGE